MRHGGGLILVTFLCTTNWKNCERKIKEGKGEVKEKKIKENKERILVATVVVFFSWRKERKERRRTKDNKLNRSLEKKHHGGRPKV